MLKRLFVLFWLWIAVFSGSRELCAQKLYIFSEGGYCEKARGEEDWQDNDRIRDTIRKNMPPEYIVCYNDRTGFGEGSECEWTGPDIDKSENVYNDILEAIKRCPAGSDDTIFFHWTGPTAYDEEEHFLLMPKEKGRPTMYRSEILEALKNKNPRLIVLITDSCQTYFPWVSVDPDFGRGGFQISFLLTEGLPLLYANLFFQYQGVLDMDSSCPKHNVDDNFSRVVDALSDLHGFGTIGGETVFTGVASDILEKKRLEPYSWQTFISQVNSTSFSRRFGLKTRVWQYPEKLPSCSIPDTEITRTGTWRITWFGPNGQVNETYKPYVRQGNGMSGRRMQRRYSW